MCHFYANVAHIGAEHHVWLASGHSRPEIIFYSLLDRYESLTLWGLAVDRLSMRYSQHHRELSAIAPHFGRSSVDGLSISSRTTLEGLKQVLTESVPLSEIYQE